MNAYQAVMAAADTIEQNPRAFLFGATSVPRDCRTPGCALGWVAHHAGLWVPGGYTSYSVGASALGVGVFEFYQRMCRLTGAHWNDVVWPWMRDAAECARGLRLYAEEYHGNQKPGIPDAVRNLFNVKEFENV
jgi:hypothetical protein